MINREKTRQKKLNNKGSALVVVIIVIAFICILATLILYLSVMNYQMKANDYRTKVSFYGAEIPMEELRVQMAVDMSSACEKAYMDVMSQFDIMLDGTGDARKTEYIGAVFTELEAIWDDRNYVVADGTSSWVQGISVALQDTSTDEYHVINGDATTLTCTDADCDCTYHIIVVDMAGADRIEFDEATGKAVINDIKVVYTENSFTSVIATDFCFYIPELDWSIEGYSDTWADGTSTTERTKIDYEKCVVYLNWTKQ